MDLPPCCSSRRWERRYKKHHLKIEDFVWGMDLALNGKDLLEWKTFHVLRKMYHRNVEHHVMKNPDKLCLNREAVQNSDGKP